MGTMCSKPLSIVLTLFDRNLNTMEQQESSNRMVKATNVIYHDHDHPSALIIPVMSRGHRT